MQNYKKLNLMRDYDKVKAAIKHPNNKKEHIQPLQNLISLFYHKHGFGIYEYIKDLNDQLSELNERLFDEHIKNLENGNIN